jgi:anti-sigma regulatory factor (Ser/Thr protein kinase)
MPRLRFSRYEAQVAKDDNRCQMPFIYYRPRSHARRLPSTQARRERTTMAVTATAETTSLVAFTLPGTPYSVRMARFYVRAALGYHDLGDYAGDVETVTSELVSNAIAHAGARAINLELMHMDDPGAVVVVVTDPSPIPPVMRDPAGDAEHGRGLLVVAALSARWGWTRQDPGKAVFAVFTRES